MKKSVILGVMFGVGLALSSCVRNDDEPIIPKAPISRLYVSLFEYQTDESADPYANLFIADPADGELMKGTFFNPSIKEGGGVFFSPDVSRVFQGSILDRSIVLMSVSDIGIPQRSGQISNEELTAIRGLHYHHDSRNLYVANNWTPSGIYVFDTPLNRNGEVEPLRYFPLGGVRPWGITMWEDHLLVTRTGEQGGVNLYRNVSTQLTGDSDLVPDAVLTISGANAIRGVAYSSRLDVLVLSDYDQARIYIIEEASQYFAQASSTVTPSRVITGSSTGLMGPVDVSLDDREGAGNLYVADKRAKSVLRFKISDQGNVQPQSVVSFPLSPEAVYIDARGQIQPVE
jgi:hypothetical protein